MLFLRNELLTVKDAKDADKITVTYYPADSELQTIQLQVETTEKGSIILYWNMLSKQMRTLGRVDHKYERLIEEFYEPISKQH